MLVRDPGGLDLAWGSPEGRVSLPAGDYAVFVFFLDPPHVGTSSPGLLEEGCSEVGTLVFG